MRKGFFLVVIGCLFGMTSNAAYHDDGGPGNPIEIKNPDTGPTNRPRAPRRAATFQVFYDQAQSALLVSSPTDVGIVIAVVENLSTGAFDIYSFDSSELAILPVSGESGFWRVTLYFSHKTISYVFSVD